MFLQPPPFLPVSNLAVDERFVLPSIYLELPWPWGPIQVGLRGARCPLRPRADSSSKWKQCRPCICRTIKVSSRISSNTAQRLASCRTIDSMQQDTGRCLLNSASSRALTRFPSAALHMAVDKILLQSISSCRDNECSPAKLSPYP